LAAIVGTRIWADQAKPKSPQTPDSEYYPFVLYNFQAGSDVPALGTVRLMTLPLMQVRAVGKGQPDANLRAADVRIDEVLQNASAQTSGGYVISARREFPVDRPEYDSANVRYHNLGGLYRLYISKQ
jgi:hypothetical protein